jgi:hypothetical protein
MGSIYKCPDAPRFLFRAFALLLLFLVYSKHCFNGKTKLELVKGLDFVGLLLASAARILFLLGVTGVVDNLRGSQAMSWRTGAYG